MFSRYWIKYHLKKSKAVLNCYKRISDSFNATLVRISPLLFVKLRFRTKRHKWPNLKNPQSFDEKLLWLNLYWRHPLKTKCGEKYTMRAYVKEHGLEHLLPQLLGLYENSNEIDFDSLPQRFVLKCTRGSGFNIVCKEKSDLDVKDTKCKLDAWMKVDTSKCGELHYAAMKRRIICESFLDDSSSDLPSDYKVFCFNGKAHCTMACTERRLNMRAKYDFYDLSWKNKLPYSRTSLLANRNIPKPEAYEEIIAAAEILSKPFPFVRMDFYSINGKAVIGEMTFTPEACIDVNLTDLAQRILGELINLPEKRIK
ncbi:MAG: hypothetical protein LUQ65_04360 [Candidatus Helarchaeota archaeon]|nr:hypothetical protein [Candidatus Helarchaeota archaeon]